MPETYPWGCVGMDGKTEGRIEGKMEGRIEGRVEDRIVQEVRFGLCSGCRASHRAALSAADFSTLVRFGRICPAVHILLSELRPFLCPFSTLKSVLPAFISTSSLLFLRLSCYIGILQTTFHSTIPFILHSNYTSCSDFVLVSPRLFYQRLSASRHTI